jgi:hypothetical protein
MLNLEEGREISETEKEVVRKLVEDIHQFKRVNQRFRGGHSRARRQKSREP